MIQSNVCNCPMTGWRSCYSKKISKLFLPSLFFDFSFYLRQAKKEKKRKMHTAEALVANRTHASSASVFVGHTSDIQMKQVIHAAYPIAGNGLAGHDFVDHLTNKSCTGSGLLRHRNLVTKTGT